MYRFFAASLLSLLTSAAIAQSPPANSASSADDGAKVVCRSQTVTGSIMPHKRVCHTKDQWREIESAGRDEASRMRDRPQFTPRG